MERFLCGCRKKNKETFSLLAKSLLLSLDGEALL